ncbi:hypothetical protein [Actinomyces haliotis]|uniref:hypothetical protein n=1 Tax=Actinomyces haliotis TaxID=1280843 RepID=UPI00188E748A|nr:hypothetical protein [Actinomyces haliotis]
MTEAGTRPAAGRRLGRFLAGGVDACRHDHDDLAPPPPAPGADATRQDLPQNTSPLGTGHHGGGVIAAPEHLPLQDAALRPWVALALAGVAVVLLAGVRLHASSADLAVTAWFNAHRVGVVGALTTGLYRYLEPPYAAALAIVIVPGGGACTARPPWP